MIAFVKTTFAKSLLAKLSNDSKLTWLGLAASALIACRLDWPKLLQGDPEQLGNAAGAVVAALIGYWTNKPDKPTK